MITIYSMTATFGKLEGETLTLKPGLNIIEAPNEWGKSTWCAFLLAMLYGLDTRAKTTKNVLADKEHYAPWSGALMSGRIDLNWNGRDITIQRLTRKRVPLGEFRAFETDSGLPVPELNAANCGQMLLGVEQSVYRRSGFIRQSDMPVTQDEALLRRLNALVTTGDESGDGERLASQLRELRNRCRYNRTGLLPQAEEERKAVEQKLQELDNLNTQCRKLRQRLEEGKQWQQELQNHLAALRFAAAREDAQRVALARDARDQGLKNLTALEHATAALPEEEALRRKTGELRQHLQLWNDLQLEIQMQADPPASQMHPVFGGLTGEEAVAQARADGEAYRAAAPLAPWLLGAMLSLAAAIAVGIFLKPVWALIPAAVFLAALAGAFRTGNRQKRNRVNMEEIYGSANPEHWIADAQQYADALTRRQEAAARFHAERAELEQRLQNLRMQRQTLTREEAPERVLQLWEQALNQWEEYRTALREQAKLESHLADLQAMARKAARPVLEDSLDCSEEKTQILLREAEEEQLRLQQRLSQYRGRMEVLGDRDGLKKQHAALCEKISRLEETYEALTLAMDTLAEARRELQRRFAPRIAKQAQKNLSVMTGGRYSRFTLGNDFSLQAGTEQENVLRDAWWRSDGTMDQMYLALRLAVAGELIPEAPLILDDALVRFDEDRLSTALKLLRDEAQGRQVLLFTCQSREKKLLEML